MFSDPAARSLVQEGKLDPRWVGAFFSLPGPDQVDSQTWTPEFFRLRHFASMYLPMRYAVWTKSSGKRNPQAEGLLATLIVAIAETLWRSLIAAANLGEPKDEPGLVRLVLGAENPLRLADDARADWDRQYTSTVKAMSSVWRARQSWPRWESMALHVASFYLPMGLPTGPISPDCARPSAAHQQLLDDLGSYLHADVVQLIGLWLASADALRDNAGVPMVTWNAGRRGRLTGRTETELLLLG